MMISGLVRPYSPRATPPSELMDELGVRTEEITNSVHHVVTPTFLLHL